MTDVYAISEDKGGPGGQWFHHVVTARALTDVETTRARRYCAANAVDREELGMFLAMLGLEERR